MERRPLISLTAINWTVKLKELSLGVKTQHVEKVIIDQDWFKSL